MIGNSFERVIKIKQKKQKDSEDKFRIGSQYIYNMTDETFEVVGTDRDRLPYRNPVTIYLRSLWDGTRRVVLDYELEDFYKYIQPMKGAYK